MGGCRDGRSGGWLLTDQRYLRCAPGRTNPLYPPGPEPENRGELCTPTIDDLHYESVSLDLAQLDRQGPEGIWVVNGWRLTVPFTQADPVVVEARPRNAWRSSSPHESPAKAPKGTCWSTPDIDVPLLYATTSGASDEQYEMERVAGRGGPMAG